MDLVTLIPLALKASIVLIVFGLGLSASVDDIFYLFRRPGQLVRSLLAMNVIMPLFAALLAGFFDLNPALEIALTALAVSPVPPVLPKKQLKSGGRASYAVGLLVAAALLAIIFIPAAMVLLGRAFHHTVHMSAATVALIVLSTVLAPLAAGIAVRRMAGAFAERSAQPVLLVGSALLILGFLPVLFGAWPVFVSLIGNGTLLAMAVFTVVGLAAGHLLGGPEPEDRLVLALATATRHPGVALAIVTANYHGSAPVLAAVLLYAIISALITIPYLVWHKRSHGGVASPMAPAHRA